MTDITGTSGSDRIKITADGNYVISSGDGTDTITVNAVTGDISIDAGTGNDTITVNNLTGDVVIDGGDGNDVIKINGATGDLTILAGSGDDVVKITDVTGDLIINAGTGADEITVNRVDGSVFIDAGDGSDRVVVNNVTGLTTILGGTGDDQINGGSEDDLIFGGDGNDTITAGAGHDEIHGGAGNDKLVGGKGDDLLFGDDGNDTITGNGGNDVVYGGAGDDNLIGGQGNDKLYGDAGNDVLMGNGGNDELHGGDGNDALVGNNGSDLMYGDAGDDTIIGNNGNDTMYGGAGNDVITGGNSADVADGGAGNDTLKLVGGNDTATLNLVEDRLSTDSYDGGSGTDTLIISYNAQVLSAIGYSAQDIINYFNANLGNVNFSSLGFNLTATNFEHIQLVDLGSTGNTAPVAVNDIYTGLEDSPIVGNVLTNDTDADNNSLTASLIVGPTYGMLTFHADGSFSYLANSNYSGTDSFTYTAYDGTDNSNIATVTLNITAVADTPVLLVTSTAVGNEDTAIPLNITSVLTDTDGSESLSIKIQGIPNGATLSAGTHNLDGSWTLTPAELLGLTLTPAENSSNSFNIMVTATSIEGSNGSSASTSANIHVVVNPVNDAAILSSASVDLTETDAVLTTSGQLTISDIDSPALFVAQNNSAGLYGSFSIDASGAWSYTASNAHDEFVDGQQYLDVFTVSSEDGTLTSVTITITGTNDAAVLSADVRELTETDAQLSASGALSISDVDSPAQYISQNNSGTYGSFSIDSSGNWNYATSGAHDEFAEGQIYTDVFDVLSVDGTHTSVTINITGTNDAAILSADVRELTETNEPLTASGVLTVSDVDNPALYVAQTIAGNFGSLSIDASGAWNYAASNAHDEFVEGQQYSDVFDVVSVDGTHTSVTINITGTNDAAVLSADVRELTETNETLTASGALTVSDVDSPAQYISQSNSGTYGSFSIDSSGNWNYVAYTAHDEFVDGEQYSDVFTVSSSDGTQTSVTINITGTNDAAILSADVRLLTETDETLTASGALSISDVDNPAQYIAQTLDGLFGSLTIDASGSWNYTALSAHDEFVEGVQYSDTFDIRSVDGTHTSITINILGTNDAAVLSSAVVPLTETNSANDISASGQLSITDVDNSPLYLAQNNTPGTYGSFSISASGAWDYVASSAHDEFVEGQQYTDVFDVMSVDGTHTSVTINILGTNDAAILSADVRELTETNEALTASGALTISDVDSPAQYISQNTSGTYGSFSIDSSGNWNYATSDAHDEFAEGQIYTDVFDVMSVDGTHTSVTINITGTNDAAILSSDVRELTETNAPLIASGVLTISDVDNPAQYVAQTIDGNFGSLSIDASGAWNYEASSAHDEFVEGPQYSDVFDVMSVDGTHTSVTINITGTNDAAVLSADVRELTETNEPLSASGTLTISDVDSPEFYFPQHTFGTYGSFFIDTPGNWNYSAYSAHDEFAEGQTYTDVFDVASADGTHTSVTINILGTNDSAVLSSDVRSLTESNAPLTAFGVLTISDVDNPALYVEQTIAGNFGSLSIDAAGAWNYEASSAHDEFVEGQQYNDVFDVVSVDGTHTSVTINITGTNDAAVLSSAVVPLTETNAQLTASGTLTISDVDSPEFYFPQDTFGTYGSFSIDAFGNWNYGTFSAHDGFVDGQQYADVFNVVSIDGTHTSVTINILGTNDAALLSADVRNLTETNSANDISTSGQLSISDVDSDAQYVAQITDGLYGTFSMNASGSWIYEASSAHDEFAEGQTYTDVFDVMSVDGTHTSVTINILGTNDAAVLSSAVVPLTETDAPLTASGTLTISDVDSPAVYVAQDNTAGSYGAFSIDASGNWNYLASSAYNEWADGQQYSDLFTVSSADGTLTSVAINLTGSNDAPIVANAIADQEVNEDSFFSLSIPGTFSDADLGDSLTYSATLADGSTLPSWLSFNGSNLFGSPLNEDVGSLVVRITATDTLGASVYNDFNLTVNNTNDAPTAGEISIATDEDHVASLTTADLIAASSDPDVGDSLSIASVSHVSNFGVPISYDGTTISYDPSQYNYLAPGQSVSDFFQYTVQDQAGMQSTANITITIDGVNDAPVFNYGFADISIIAGTQFSSFGIGFNQVTDPDQNDSLTYSAALSNGDPLPSWITFSNDQFSGASTLFDVGTYAISLTATDNYGGYAVTSFNITVEPVQLFTNFSDNINFDDGSVPATGYSDGTQYAALDGDDTVVLPNSAASANASGYALTDSTHTQAFDAGAGNDTVTGGDFDDTIYGGDGNDQIMGGAGDDILRGGSSIGSGRNILAGDGRNDTLNDGDDTFLLGEGFNLVDGDGAGIDTIDYSYFVGLNDSGVNISIAAGGGTTDGTLSSGVGILDQFVGIEAIRGSSLNDTINVSMIGNDSYTFYGMAGIDVIHGGNGNEYIEGGADADILDGGAGIDTLSYASSQAGVSIDFNGPVDEDGRITGSGGEADGDLIKNFENITGSAFDDTLIGDANDNVIDGGAGSDILDGGDGIDTVTYANHLTLDPQGIMGYYIDLEGGIGASFATPTPDSDMLSNFENVIGSAYNDTIFGNALDNQLEGSLGNDNIFGNAGNDTLIGGDGNDNLNGGLGSDILQGDAGNDILNGDDDDDTLTGGEGDDTVNGGNGNDLIYAGAGNDAIDGGTGSSDKISYATYAAAIFADLSANTITKVDGVDNVHNVEMIDGTNFDDQMTGDANDNTLDAKEGNNLVFGGGGNDTLIAGGGSDQLNGDAGNDTLHGGAGNDILQGGDGDDTLYGDAGADQLLGGNGNDTMYAEGNDSLVNGGAGIDTADYSNSSIGIRINLGSQSVSTSSGIALHNIFSVENVVGTLNFANTIVGNSSNNILVGGNLNDTISGAAGADSLYGGAGNDTFNIDSADIVVDGGSGVDTTSFASFATALTIDTRGGLVTNNASVNMTFINMENVTGTAFNDLIYGNDVDNVLNGGDGNDVIRPGLGNNTINGGNGDDTVDYSDITTGGVTVTLGLSSNSAIGTGINDALSSIANVIGSDFNDIIHLTDFPGTSRTAVIEGRGGNDLLIGQRGATLDGGDGNDTLTGADGGNHYIGGNDIDTVDYTGTASNLTVNLNPNSGFPGTTFYSNGTTPMDILESVENIKGGNGDDSITGNGLNNVLRGDNGNDSLNGSGGNDTLIGGSGNNTYTGGSGNDTFQWAPGSQDTITDFTHGQDVIDLAFFNTFAANVNLAQNDSNTIVTITGFSDQLTLLGVQADTLDIGTDFRF